MHIIVNGIAKMGSVLPLVDSEDFAAFNVLTEENKKFVSLDQVKE